MGEFGCIGASIDVVGCSRILVGSGFWRSMIIVGWARIKLKDS